MNILFICSKNRWRSLTAEKMYRDKPGLSVQSAGTSENARIRVSSKHLKWADIIFVMEHKQQDILEEKFPQELQNKNIVNLDIPDRYTYMDKELVELLGQVDQILNEM
ncbi:MAG: hypothetical protein QG639_956 [Patescibacteria group bacterium]|nr:hypothetical protein [Patescibacteria group bacterium]